MLFDRQNRWLLLLSALSSYAAVFLALWETTTPALGIACFFIVPTALLALAGGWRSGAAGSILAAFLVLTAGFHHPAVAGLPTLALGTAIRAAAFLCSGVLIGWFADRQRSLVGELQQLSERDPLTGIGNTRAFEAAMQERLQSDSCFALLLADMDDLKAVNDEEGHAAGDQALKRLASVLREQLAPEAALARIGGDEFSIITEVADYGEPEQLAARLEALATRIGTPATFGWAIYPVDEAHQTSLFKLADERLYARKRKTSATAGEPRLVLAHSSAS